MTVEFVRRGIIAKAGDLAVTIYLADANRFTPGEDKAAKYTHLNIAFDGELPKNSRGIFAELAGVQAMSAATNALLKQPKGVWAGGRCWACL